MLLGLGLGVMRGERERPPLRGAYWLLAAIYLIASLGHALASGNGPAVALALCAPAGIVLFPCIVAEGASVATESVVDQLWELEHSEDSVATAVDAWLDGFMDDFKRLHSVDRRQSNGGGHTKEEIAKVTDDWEAKADWIRHVERLRHAGVQHEFKTALNQRGIKPRVLVAGQLVTNRH